MYRKILSVVGVLGALLTSGCGGGGDAGFTLSGEISGIGEGDKVNLEINNAYRGTFTDGPFSLQVFAQQIHVEVEPLEDDVRCDIDPVSGTSNDTAGVRIECRRILLLRAQTPESGAANVDRKADITLTFQRPIDPDTLGHISLRSLATGQIIDRFIAINPDNPRQVLITRTDTQLGEIKVVPLKRNEPHELRIAAGLAAEDGALLEESIAVRFKSAGERTWRMNSEDRRIQPAGRVHVNGVDYLLYNDEYDRLMAAAYDSSLRVWCFDNAVEVLPPDTPLLAWETVADGLLFVFSVGYNELNWRHVALPDGVVLGDGLITSLYADRIDFMHASVSVSPDQNNALIGFQAVSERMQCTPEHWAQEVSNCREVDNWLAEWNTMTGSGTPVLLNGNNLALVVLPPTGAMANNGRALFVTDVATLNASGESVVRPVLHYRASSSSAWESDTDFAWRSLSRPIHSSAGDAVHVAFITDTETGIRTIDADGLSSAFVEATDLSDVRVFSGRRNSDNLGADVNGTLHVADASSGISLFTYSSYDETWRNEHLQAEKNVTEARAMAGWNPVALREETAVLYTIAQGHDEAHYLLFDPGSEARITDSAPVRAFAFRMREPTTFSTHDGGYHILQSNGGTLFWLVYD